MNTNKDALDAFEWLYRSYIQANNCSVANKAADAIRQALQTQAELEAKNRELSRQIDNLIKENAKYEVRHKAWSEQVYLASPAPMIMATRTTEYGDDSGTIPVANITDLLDKQAELVEALKFAQFALEPWDDVKPRDWKSDRENLKRAHQKIKQALARAEGRE